MNKEHIWVIKTAELYQNQYVREGIIPYHESIAEDIMTKGFTYRRDKAEQDATYKQIVSYIMCVHRGNIFLMQRNAHIHESTLANKYSIGIGGHLNPHDIARSINLWGIREFCEEVIYHGSYSLKPYAFINDNSNAIGSLHLGLVHIMQVEDEHITIKSEFRKGSFVKIEEIAFYYNNLESWSQLLFNTYHQATRIN
jgi:predicted NUDIX family phosphoesterase